MRAIDCQIVSGVDYRALNSIPEGFAMHGTKPNL